MFRDPSSADLPTFLASRLSSLSGPFFTSFFSSEAFVDIGFRSSPPSCFDWPDGFSWDSFLAFRLRLSRLLDLEELLLLLEDDGDLERDLSFRLFLTVGEGVRARFLLSRLASFSGERDRLRLGRLLLLPFPSSTERDRLLLAVLFRRPVATGERD
jgi:hypothetical protein